MREPWLLTHVPPSFFFVVQKQHIKNTKGSGALSSAPTPAAPAASKKRPHSASAASGSDALGAEKRPKHLLSSLAGGAPPDPLSQAQTQQIIQQQMQQQMLLQHLLALQQFQAQGGQMQQAQVVNPLAPAEAPAAPEPGGEAP